MGESAMESVIGDAGRGDEHEVINGHAGGCGVVEDVQRELRARVGG